LPRHRRDSERSCKWNIPGTANGTPRETVDTHSLGRYGQFKKNNSLSYEAND